MGSVADSLWYVTSQQVQQCTDPRDQPIALVLGVELQTLGEKHGCASAPAAVYLSKT